MLYSVVFVVMFSSCGGVLSSGDMVVLVVVYPRVCMYVLAGYSQD